MTQPNNPTPGWGVQPSGAVTKTQTGPPPQPTYPPQTQPPRGNTVQMPLFPERAAIPQQPQQPVVPVAIPQAPAPAVVAPVTQPGPVPTVASIQQLLRAFTKQDGCDRYSSESEKIKLLGTYLWLRQLTPSLPFETFLELFAPVANFDDDNLKHPDDAIKALLPRSKKAATERGCSQWTAKDAVDYIALYVDMIRAAEATNTPVPLELNQFLTNGDMIAMFQRGDFKEVAQPSEPAGKAGKTKTSKGKEPERPGAPGQRCIYTQSGGRQHRGVITELWQQEETGGHWFANFKADTGEVFPNVGLVTLEVCDDPVPIAVTDVDGEELPLIAHETFTIPKRDFVLFVKDLAMEAPIGTIAIGDNCRATQHAFQNGYSVGFYVVNGETKPYLDVFMTSPIVNGNSTIVCELPPRDHIEGDYQFNVPTVGTFKLTVKGHA